MGNVTPLISLGDPRLSHWLPAAIGGFFLLSILLSAGCTRRAESLFPFLLITALIFCVAAIPSCGGGGRGAQITPANNNGTPPGSYTVTVYAFTEINIGDGANSNADASVAVSLTVN